MNKYGAVRTVVDGHTFPSKKEAEHFRTLLTLRYARNPAQRVAEIACQYPFPCHAPDGTLVGKFLCDFKVTFADGHVEYHDPKGCKEGTAYAFFRWKKKHVEAEYGVAIIEK